MEKMSDLEKRQAEARDKLAKEIRLAALLPIEPTYIHAFKTETYLTYKIEREHGLNGPMPLADALRIYQAYRALIVPAEMRRAGCLSILPPAIQDARYADGPLDGISAIALLLSGGNGFGPDREIEFHAQIGAEFFRVKIDVVLPLYATGDRERDYRGKLIGPVRWSAPFIDGTKRIKWQSGSDDAYRFSWHFATVEAFDVWAAK